MIGMSSVSVSNIRNGKDGGTGVGIEDSYVEYSYGGSATVPPGNFLLDENGNYLIDENGEYLMDGIWYSSVPSVPPGLYLWSRTVTKYSDGRESYMYSVGKEGNSILRETRQFYLSNSYTALEGGYWMDEDEVTYPVPEGKYLWGRFEFLMTNGEVHYSNPCYQKTLNGVISDVNRNTLSITNKVWQEDIESEIQDYDNTTITTIRNQQTSNIQDLQGIWTSITDDTVETVTDSAGNVHTTMASRMYTAEQTAERFSRIIEGSDSTLGTTRTMAEQTATYLSWLVETDGKTASTFTLKDRVADLTAEYINFNGKISFNGMDDELKGRLTEVEGAVDGLNTDITNSAISILQTWTGSAQLATTTINGGFIDAHTIQAQHLATNAIMSFGTQNPQTGEYSNGYLRDNGSVFSTRGSYFNMETGNLITPDFSVIKSNTGTEADLTVQQIGAYFRGNITANSGTIGGWNIATGVLYTTSSTPGNNTMVLYPSGVQAKDIGGATTNQTWAFTIKDGFGVTTAGKLWATGANISGAITAISGVIGGININSQYGIYTGNKYAASSTEEGFLISNQGQIFLGKYNATNQSTAFQVNKTGYVKAYNIDVLGGNVGGWKVQNSMLYYNSNQSATSPATPSSTAIILSPLGNTQTVNVGGSGNTSKTWAITAGTGFGVTTSGELWCNNAHVNGYIEATSGIIGGCRIVNGVLDVGSATIGEISGDQITVGTISADRINISNLGELSENLGTITSGQIGDSINGITIGSDSTSAWIYYDKVSLVGDIGSNGFYIGTDGIAFGKNNTFKMTKDGVGNIGPWYIDGTSISKKGTNTTSQIKPSTFKESGTGNMYFGNNGLSISDVFYVDNTGSLTATNATITGRMIADKYQMYNYITMGGRQIQVITDVITAQNMTGNEAAVITVGDGNQLYPASIDLVYAGTANVGEAKAGSITISAPTKIQLTSNNVTTDSLYLDTKLQIGNSVQLTADSSNRLAVNNGIKATTVFSTSGVFRAFYDGNSTVPCVQVLSTPSGITSDSWLPVYSVIFGSTSSNNCIAVPIDGDDIFFRIKSSSTATSYKWYSLRDDILSGSGGGTTYTAGNGINISSGTISIAPSEVASSLSSYFAASSHTHQDTSAYIYAARLCSKIVCYNDNEGHSTAAANTVSWGFGSNAPSDFDSPQRLFKGSSSSKRYKDYISDVTIEQAVKVLEIPVINFKYKDGYLHNEDEMVGKSMPGLYAEDVEKAIPEAVYHLNGIDSPVENWKERIIIPLMLRVIQDQQKRIEELESKLI